MTEVLPADGVEGLLRAWVSRNASEWQEVSRYLHFGRSAIEIGQPTFGFDVLKEGLAAFPDDVQLRYYAALALAKGGARGIAASQLDQLLAITDLDPHLRSEALSLAGRLAKDRFAMLDQRGARKRAAVQSWERYREAYALSGDFFPGINAATMCVLAGQAQEGRRLAREVLDRCRAKERDDGAGDRWLCATFGEALVLLGERGEALRWYRQARELSGKRYGDIASMRRQLRLLAPTIEIAAEALEVLRIPRVALFAGHMLDRPDRPQPRFPPSLVPAVEQAIVRILEESDVGFAYCSAACGADILFIEQALARDIEVNVTLPFAREDFVRTSVVFAGGEWVGRFERALAKAATVGTCVDEGYLGDDMLYGFCQQQLQGTAMLRAQQLETEALLVAVADPGSPEESGGTQAMLRAWRELGGATRNVDLADLRRGVAVETRKASTALAAAESSVPIRGRRQIRTMLFGDVAGFSKLREEEAPSFFVNFLGLVADQIRRSDAAPEVRNTWGDGLYLVYENVAAAADFALRLRDRIASNDWQAQGLPQGLSARIGMHSGPVFRAFDPIVSRESFFGSHVTRAARIEPVAAPGSVYVSEQTAALLSAGGHREFACDYLGNMVLAKGYGSSALYRLRRTAEED